MTALLAVLLLATALGIDLGLTLLVLGVLPAIGLEVVWLERITGLQTVPVLLIVALFWIAETILEQVSITVMALWHAAQAVARPAAAFLLAGVLLPDLDPALRTVVMVSAAGIALLVHAGAVGWLAFLHLIGLPSRPRRVASAAEDAVVVALLVLGAEHLWVAIGLVGLLATAGLRQHLTSLAGFQVLLRGVVGDARSLIAEGSWWLPDLYPAWLRPRIAADDMDRTLPGRDRLRGTPAALLEPAPARLRHGWLVVGNGRRRFIPRWGSGTDLAAPAAGVQREPMLTRVVWDDGQVLLIPPDGPTPRQLESEFLA